VGRFFCDRQAVWCRFRGSFRAQDGLTETADSDYYTPATLLSLQIPFDIVSPANARKPCGISRMSSRAIVRLRACQDEKSTDGLNHPSAPPSSTASV